MSEKFTNTVEAGLNSGEKSEVIRQAQEIYGELQKYNEQIVDKDTYQKLKELSAKLKEHLTGLTWEERSKNGLPWNPVDELTRTIESAANDNRATVEAKAA